MTNENEKIIWDYKALKLWLSEPSKFSDDRWCVLATTSKKSFYKYLVEEDIIEDEDFTLEDFLKWVGEDYIKYEKREEEDYEFEGSIARWAGAKPKSKWSYKIWTRW